MRGTRNRGAMLRLAMFAGASVVAAGALAGAGGVALAGPRPRPPGQSQGDGGGHAGKGTLGAGHTGTGRRAGHHHTRPRTVVRCQNDGTDQIDEIDNDGDEPRHIVSPDPVAPTGSCPGFKNALGMAGLLGGDHRTRTDRAWRARAMQPRVMQPRVIGTRAVRR